MKKNVCLFITAMTLVCCFTACSEKSSDATANSSAIESSLAETSATESSELDICYADLLPKTEDYFKNPEIITIDTDGGKAYAFRIKGYQDGEYEAYINACKELGFTDISYEGENDGGKMFYAYSADKEYYLQVSLGNKIEAIDVSCKKSKKEES